VVIALGDPDRESRTTNIRRLAEILEVPAR
jgi:hypothetical protein